jgi:hypothetical protein
MGETLFIIKFLFDENSCPAPELLQLKLGAQVVDISIHICESYHILIVRNNSIR